MATAAASATAVTSTPAASATTTFTLRARFVHNERATHEIPSVESRNRFFSLPVVPDFCKSEPPGLAGETISQQSKIIWLHTCFRKQRRYLIFRGLERKVAHVQFFHDILLVPASLRRAREAGRGRIETEGSWKAAATG
jgi:hypothetical protein